MATLVTDRDAQRFAEQVMREAMVMKSQLAPKVSEHGEQCTVIEWARAHEGVEPRLGLLFAIPNGAKLPYTKSSRGVRYSPEAIRLKSEGLRPGVPDLFLPVPEYGGGDDLPFGEFVQWHGLFIEMKSLGGTLTVEQKEMIEQLRTQGYRVEVCHGAEQAIAVLQEYLGMDRQVAMELPRAAGRGRK
jgi:hypothetical protein